jgi:hypothetical protein
MQRDFQAVDIIARLAEVWPIADDFLLESGQIGPIFVPRR